MDKEIRREMGQDWLRPSRWLPRVLGGIAAVPALMLLALLAVCLLTGDYGPGDLLPAVFTLLGCMLAMVAVPVAFWLVERRGRREMAAYFSALSPGERERFRWEAKQFAAAGGFYCGVNGLWCRYSTQRHSLSPPFHRVAVIPYGDIAWAYAEFAWADAPPPTAGTPPSRMGAVSTMGGGGVVFYTKDGLRHKYSANEQSLPPQELVESLGPHLPHALMGFSEERARLARRDFDRLLP